jgi:hypothetical protein
MFAGKNSCKGDVEMAVQQTLKREYGRRTVVPSRDCLALAANVDCGSAHN